MPRVIFINRFFFPDHSATSQILSDLAFHLAAEGEDVHVIASRQLYGDAAANLPAHESIRGVEIHRIATTRFGRRSLIGRSFDYASFYAASVFKLLCVAKRGDVVVAKTDPPMLSVLASTVAKWRGLKTVNWLQDLYPELATELGVTALKSPLGRLLIKARNASLRGATMNVAIGEDMAKRLRAAGVPAERLSVVANWSDDETIRPSDSVSNPLRRAWSLEGKFVVAYSGNLGRAHDAGTLIGAAERLQARGDIVFLFIGDGSGHAELASEVEKRGLSNFRFRPYQPREMLPQSLGVADIHWLSLKPGLDGLVLPSKFYGIAAAGRPILLVSSTGSELAELIGRHSCGFSVAHGRDEELAALILALADNPERCREMGAKARGMLDDNLTKSRALARWHAILKQAGLKQAGGTET